MKLTKENIRKEISVIKKKLTSDELKFQSDEVISVLEATDTFCKARNIIIYNSLPDEVHTDSILKRYAGDKRFFLPVVVDNTTLAIREYAPDMSFSTSNLGIKEPQGENFTDWKKIDLIIVPGVAFDRQLNRLGRGKGYYDRFLKQVKAPKIGICFEFQLLDKIPIDEHDIPMDMVVTENEIICDGIY
ncbi:5-formyltetrahydrofolate cyclo-ligase [Dysgonomonas sp. 520]|uniref:5-formyltetrahydrofolate cyclo-ligase n=1 Tax=Dysgonomonas sp. 520 TaxID=2302931 RepID=UPI0013D632E0|nr:5-formyltetrahydrofolate cyclo-ligase [Dysgonomonas sp. 520]NDW09177.1 5-formyltetrahydrofolate cyclo-ligase [Dysgonomonas sp. 520]